MISYVVPWAENPVPLSSLEDLVIVSSTVAVLHLDPGVIPELLGGSFSTVDGPVPVGSQLKSGTISVAYSTAIAAQSGTAPYSFAVTAGALPAGLSMSSAGVISGTPSVAGTFSFEVTTTDSSSATGVQAFQITIQSAGGFTVLKTNYGFTA